MNERELFFAALEIEPAQRRAYLNEVCGQDAALRSRLEKQLESHQDSTQFLSPNTLALPCELTTSADLVLAADNRSRATRDSFNFLLPTQRTDALGRLGHYEILEVVGQGGFGIVFKAFDESLRRIVAVKVLAAPFAGNPQSRERFLREAHAAAAVCHDNVVTIHAIESTTTPPYLVMQFIDGISLQEKLALPGSSSVMEIMRLGMQIASGLAAAHKQGLVHRDIKPANILLENGIQRVKITDFGLARATDDVQLTSAGVVAGTPQYMSPEQARGEIVDLRSDLFSLGSVMYRICSGREAFSALSTLAVLKQVCEIDPPPIRALNPEIPLGLADLVHKLLAKKADDRYSSAQHVADLLQDQLIALRRMSTQAALPSSDLPTKTVDASRNIILIRCAIAIAALCLGTTIVLINSANLANKPAHSIKDPIGGLAINNQQPDRIAAQWVLDSGGSVELRTVQGTPLSLVDSRLPVEPFQLVTATLDDKSNFKAEQFRLLRNCEQLATLRFEAAPLTDECLQNLAGTSVGELWLTTCPALTNASATFISQLRDLRFLSLGSAGISDEGLKGWNALPKLHSLFLSGSGVSDQGLAHLASRCPQLAYLGINHGVSGQLTLKCCALFPNLESLDMSSEQLAADGVGQLNSHPTLHKIYIYGPWDDARLKLLSDLKQAKTLTLTSYGIESATTISPTALTELDWPDCIEQLSFEGSSISPRDTDLEQLAMQLVHLQRLFLTRSEQTRYTSAGLAKFCEQRPDVELFVAGERFNREKSTQ